VNSHSQNRQAPIVWSIGGVDPTALAGVSADNRAIAVAGAHGVNIITSVTAQNSNAFYSQHELPVDVLEQQWTALIEQCMPVVIKIGMLVSPAQVTWLGDKLKQLDTLPAKPWIIYDPVVRASSDNSPVLTELLNVIKRHLLPWVDLLTPNVHEAVLLLEEQPQSEAALMPFAQALAQKFNCQILLKGGHVNDLFDAPDVTHKQSTDYYARPKALKHTRYLPEPSWQFTLSQPYDNQENRRGSGCILASLIAGFVAQQYTFCDAILLSSGVMRKAYSNALPLGTSRGGAISLTPNVDQKLLPTIDSFNGQMVHQLLDVTAAFATCPLNLGLYPVVDSVQWLTRLLKLGVKTIQLRSKDKSQQEVEPDIVAAIALGQQYNARVFINDYWQLAIKHSAYGIHLGQEDLVVADLNAIKQAGVRLGLSTHGVFEAQWVSQLKPSYMAVGHIYATQTKDMPSRPQGLEKLAHQVAIFKETLPLVAIGGITAARVPEVVKTGIGSVALVTAITKAAKPDEVTRQLLDTVGYGASHE